ncbi:alpha/beta hydrolase [Longibacter sp.]|uniref:alpha/beta hydrolase n=1 Tax=Longibacter sp. TaxID=2045415 RepID=UPI003EB88784
MPDVHHRTLSVRRTARLCLLGDPSAPEHVYVLHGYGQTVDDFIRPFDMIASPDRCIIAPEALSRFYTDDMGKHRDVGASWMTRRDREHEISDYIHYLDDVAASLNSDGDVPTSRTVLGFSQGTATASRWALLGDTAVDRIILWAGAPAQDLDLASHADVLRNMSPTLVAGTKDPFITDERLNAVERWLQKHDIPADLHRFDGGHRLHRDTLGALFPS